MKEKNKEKQLFADYKILLVDDEEDIIEFLSYNLMREGFRVLAAHNGEEAVRVAKKELPHLILMDIMMPKMDGVTAVKHIRRIPELDHTLIVFLTARSEDFSQIAGFDAGADDYVTKPIKPKVLVKRISALLRRSKKIEKKNSALQRGRITIDPVRYVVMNREQTINLPKKEFAILYLLASKPDKVFSREEIFHEIWGDEVIVGSRTIDVHIRKIREKLNIDNIKTIKGVGYKYECKE